MHQSNNLYHHIGITIYETFLSFGIGTLLGFIIATILWWFPTLSRIIDPYLTILNSLPKVALGPILIIWAGAVMESIIWMALLISVIITIMNVYQGFMETVRFELTSAILQRYYNYQLYHIPIIPILC